VAIEAPGTTVTSARTRARHRRASYFDVLLHREFGPLLASQLISGAGDRVALLAVTYLVYRETHSALYAAATFGSWLLTWGLAGPLLSTLADRWPRRRVMIVCDLARTPLIACLALPHMPIGLMVGILAASSLFSPVFQAAREASIPDMLTGDEYVLASTINMLAAQGTWLIGFLAGGAAIAILSARGGLLVDAATFLLSAVVVRVAMRVRAASSPGQRARPLRDMLDGLRVLRESAGLEQVLLLAVLVACVLQVPEALAVVVADRFSHSAALAGALMSVPAGGMIIGMLFVGRVREQQHRLRLMLPLAALSVIPLLFMPVVHWVVLIAVTWLVASIGGGAQLPAATAFTLGAPHAYRGRLLGLAGSALMVSQLAVIDAAGAVASRVGPAWTIFTFAAAGGVGLLVVALRWSPVRSLGAAPVIDLTTHEPPLPTLDLVAADVRVPLVAQPMSPDEAMAVSGG
jgi:MFS family permease